MGVGAGSGSREGAAADWVPREVWKAVRFAMADYECGWGEALERVKCARIIRRSGRRYLYWDGKRERWRTRRLRKLIPPPQ